MYTSFHIKNFRGFTDFEIDGLQRVNLIAGRNNTGKTSLLEAVLIHARSNVYPVLNTQANRGIGINAFDPGAPAWKSVFAALDETTVIEIGGVYDGILREIQLTSEHPSQISFDSQSITNGRGFSNGEQAHLLRLTRAAYADREAVSEYLLQDTQGYSGKNIQKPVIEAAVMIASSETVSSASIASLFGRLARVKREGFLCKKLHLIDSHIRNLSIVIVDNVPSLYADTGLDELIPLNALGDGVISLTNILLHIGTNENGVVLIDEIENGFHYSILPQVWQAIAQAARDFDVQIFATTHSLEMIRAAHEAFKDDEPYDFAYHRLDRNKEGQIVAKTYDDETLEAAIELNFEVR